ncbi:bifunctional adenosylcobinamide kinase/adenosylcobinamide-phosphate guanylyltransferase [Dermacoccaceae bacterium W4C1]
MTSTTLVLGGTRSGKSRYGRSLLGRHAEVTVVIPGQGHGEDSVGAGEATDVEGLPEGWKAVRAVDVTRAILHARSPVLIDSLDAWVPTLIEDAGLWEEPEAALKLVEERAQELAALWAWAPYDAVAVCSEIGWGLVPDNPREQLHAHAAELLGAVVSGVSSRVELLVAGRILNLTDSPRLPV